MVAPALQVFLALVLVSLAGVALLVFGNTLTHLSRRGGKVRVEHFGLPDLLTASTLALFFIGLLVASLRLHDRAATTVSVEQVLPQQVFGIAIVAGLAGFLIYRHLSPARIFGLGALPVWMALLLAAAFYLAALPLVTATNYLSQLMLRDLANEQELIGLFRDLARDNNYSAMGQTFLATVILAPAYEEFLFRGYFYGVGKRYLGSLAGALVTALLFAAIHANLASLPGLFVLALCLTAGYERTGSLLVPIGMHALYNCASLAILYLQAHGRFPGVES